MTHEREQSDLGFFGGPRRIEQHGFDLLKEEEFITDHERVLAPIAFVPGNGNRGGFGGGQDFGPIAPSAPMSWFEWAIDHIPPIVVGLVVGVVVVLGTFAMVFFL
jgi:hypothetical protein